MKAAKYNTYAVFSSQGLIACKCNCQCGAAGGEAIVCVHILPLIFQLTLLLVEGLAENILLELCARMNTPETTEAHFQSNDILNMKKNINTLMTAAGGDSVVDFSDKTVTDILSSFSVGTEKRKSRVKVFRIQH